MRKWCGKQCVSLFHCSIPLVCFSCISERIVLWSYHFASKSYFPPLWLTGGSGQISEETMSKNEMIGSTEANEQAHVVSHRGTGCGKACVLPLRGVCSQPTCRNSDSYSTGVTVWILPLQTQKEILCVVYFSSFTHDENVGEGVCRHFCRSFVNC